LKQFELKEHISRQENTHLNVAKNYVYRVLEHSRNFCTGMKGADNWLKWSCVAGVSEQGGDNATVEQFC